MDPTLVLSAAIFTLLAVVVATSLLIGDAARSRRVRSEEEHPCPNSEEPTAPTEPPSSSSSSSSAEASPASSQTQAGGDAETLEVDDEGDSDEADSLKYVPGKARSHHLEKMMSEEELKQEQRVQREQLAAIFQLLRENKETFGEVTEGDMEEQLRLYSI